MRIVKFLNIHRHIGALTPGKLYEVIKYIRSSELPSNMDVISILDDNGNLMQYYMGSVFDNSITYFEDYTIKYREDVINGILT